MIRRIWPLARRLAALAAASVLLATPIKAQPEPIELALLPSLNVQALMELYRPLREYLEQRLSRPVRTVTARDYATYIERTRQRGYRYLVTAPHFARLAQRESGYIPLLRVKRDLAAIVVSPRSAALADVAGLRRRSVATPDSRAIISMLGLRILREHGLVPPHDIRLAAYSSFATALYATVSGETQAAITAETALAQMPEEIRRDVVTLARSDSVPGIMLIARDDTPAGERARLVSVFLDFERDPRSEIFLARTRFIGYRVVDDAEMASLDPYVEQLRDMLPRQ